MDSVRVLYPILCYDSEDVVGSWTKEEDDAVMAKLAVVQQKLADQGRLGPVARLLPTTRKLQCGRRSALKSSAGAGRNGRQNIGISLISSAIRSKRSSRSQRSSAS